MNNHFKLSKDKINKMIIHLNSRVKSDGFTTQIVDLEDKIVFQMKKNSGFGKILGLSKSLTVEFTFTEDGFYTLFSDSKWIDKAICGGIGTFVIFWPLLVTSAVGAVQQSSLPNKMFMYISEAVFLAKNTPPKLPTNY